MAFCMKCQKEVALLTIICPHCGHDFLDSEAPNPPARSGWEYSSLADVLLLVGAVASGLAACVLAMMLIGESVMALSYPMQWGEFAWPFAQQCVGFCLCLANMIVFLRVANLSRERR